MSGVSVTAPLANPRAWASGKAPTRDEVVIELGRELAMRRNVFPRWVEAGKLSQRQADERIDRLQAALEFISEHWPHE